jgi:hypothetical protein
MKIPITISSSISLHLLPILIFWSSSWVLRSPPWSRPDYQPALPPVPGAYAMKIPMMIASSNMAHLFG